MEGSINKNDYSVIVSVLMITYNHEKFIKEAIEGVLIQETNFPYELILANDASTDNTNTIINDFIKTHPKANLIKYFNHKINMGMMPNFIFVLDQCKGKYIALCEGDDYWTDEYKLQKQVDFLEANENIVGCFSDTITINNSGEIIGYALAEVDKKETSINNFVTFWMPTVSVCFMRNFLRLIIDSPGFLKVNNGDMFLYYMLSQYGNFGYVSTKPCIYRQHEGGVWSHVKIINKYAKNLATDFIILDSLMIQFKKSVLPRIMHNLSWQLNHFRENEHISVIWPFFRLNFKELISRGLYGNALSLFVNTVFVLFHRIILRIKRIFNY
jgi:glycosyltransferase involved in cell wall biosynthesis